MSTGAGDWGLGPSIRNVGQEDTPSAVLGKDLIKEI